MFCQIPAQSQTIIGCKVARDGKASIIDFRSGDRGTFAALEASIKHWRWRVTDPSKDSLGFYAEIVFHCRNGRFGITDYQERDLTVEAAPKYVLEAESDGIATWAKAVQGAGWTGCIRILLSLSPDGSVRDAVMVEGSILFKEIALKSAREWKFKSSCQLPPELTLSLSGIDGRPFVGYGVLGAGREKTLQH